MSSLGATQLVVSGDALLMVMEGMLRQREQKGDIDYIKNHLGQVLNMYMTQT
jgi:hypothetical protein